MRMVRMSKTSAKARPGIRNRFGRPTGNGLPLHGHQRTRPARSGWTCGSCGATVPGNNKSLTMLPVSGLPVSLGDELFNLRHRGVDDEKPTDPAVGVETDVFCVGRGDSRAPSARRNGRT